MGRAAAALIAGALAALLACGAQADENLDLERIPEVLRGEPSGRVPPAAAPAPLPLGASSWTVFAEDALGVTARRDGPVPSPAPPPAWRNRASLDARVEWRLADGLTLGLSDRFNLLAEDEVDLPSRRWLRNDFREGYLTWRADPRLWLEAGRINVRNGVALGFNPTDFFKTRTAVDQPSLDPSVIRENRLGTAMLRGQTFWDGGSASIAFAPRLYAPSRFAVDDGRSGFDPRLDRTNAANRFLAALSQEIWDLSPQTLLYVEDGRPRLGLNLSRPIGRDVVAYAEWAGGRQKSLAAAAVDYARATGTLPAGAPVPALGDTGDGFRNDLAVGASWTAPNRLTLNLEYHFHEAGLSRRDWEDWFRIGTAAAGQPTIAGELWYLRGWAADQQQPLARHQLFLRADWPDAFVKDLELAGIAFVDLYDASTLGQISASYYLSDAWTLGAYLTASLGGPRTEHGSAAEAASLILRAVRYF